MKRYAWRIFILLTAFVQLCACKKDEGAGFTPTGQTFEFGVSGQLFPGIKNQQSKSVEIIIPQDSSKNRLQPVFSVSGQGSMLANNKAIYSRVSIADFSQPVQLSILNSQQQQVDSWTVHVKTELELYGLGSVKTAGKSLTSKSNYYFDQSMSGTFANANCGPTVASMAVKWADADFKKSPKQAREAIRPEGGGWYCADVSDYLLQNGVTSMNVYLGNVEQTVKKYIDKGHLLILALDISLIKQNTNPLQKVGKAYSSPSKATGHFIVVKGYKVVDGQFFLEVYDPNSGGAVYQLNQEPKGKDRYYAASEVRKAAQDWWNYAIVVNPKN